MLNEDKKEIKQANKFKEISLNILNKIWIGIKWIFLVLFPTIFKYIWAGLKFIGKLIYKLFEDDEKTLKKKEENRNKLQYYQNLDKTDLELV